MHIKVEREYKYYLEWSGNKCLEHLGQRFYNFGHLKHWLLYGEGIYLTEYSNTDVGTIEGVREMVYQINEMGFNNELVFVEVV